MVKDGAKVVLSAATETSSWTRPESMADIAGEVLASSVTANPDKVPNRYQGDLRSVSTITSS